MQNHGYYLRATVLQTTPDDESLKALEVRTEAHVSHISSRLLENANIKKKRAKQEEWHKFPSHGSIKRSPGSYLINS